MLLFIANLSEWSIYFSSYPVLLYALKFALNHFLDGNFITCLVILVVWWIDILACTVIKPNCLLQFVADGVFKAELNNFLTRELAEDGYSGVEVRVTPTRTEIIILATRTQNVLGEKGRRIRELTSVVQKRFNFPEGTVEVIIFYSLQNWMTFIIF